MTTQPWGPDCARSALSEQFKYVTLLAQGNAAISFRGTHRATGTDCFIKVSAGQPHPGSDPVRTEAATIDALHAAGCPVLQVLDEGELDSQFAGISGPHPYLVLDFIEGGSLGALTADGPLPAARLLDAVIGLLEALQQIHSAGFVHGDVSLQNVLLGRVARELGPERVFLVDFNSATPLRTASPPALFLQPAYAAPEVARGSQPSPASDLYSAGVLTYRLLTGRFPHRVETLHDAAGIIGPPVAMPPLAGAPRLAEELVRSMLAPVPEARPSVARARECAEELREVVRWCQPRPWAGGIFMHGQPLPSATLWPRSRLAEPGPPPPPIPGPVPAIDPAAMQAEDVAPDGLSDDRLWLGLGLPEHRDQRTFMTSPTIDPRLNVSVFAPPIVEPAKAFVLEVWAFQLKDMLEANERASRGGRRVERGSRGPIQAARGTSISLKLWLEGIEVDEPLESFWWTGEITNVPFIVNVPAGASQGVHVGRLDLMQDGLLMARIVFDIEVGPGGAATAPRSLGTARRQFATAFASYASPDRGEALRRVQGIVAAGVDVFVDVLSLRAGDQWREELEANIRNRDVLYLFWSLAASRSKEVEREWRYALDQKGPDSIHPVPLESPVQVPPPAELNAKHFNDCYLAYLQTLNLGRTDVVEPG